MTGTIGNNLILKTIHRITAQTGINGNLAAVTRPGSVLSPVGTAQVVSQNVAADLLERSTMVQYPAIHIYCEKIVNSLAEKFRTFSGTAQMAIEVRHSQDRLNGLQDAVEAYAGAVTQTLDSSRGDWGDGMHYSGGYQVTFAAAKHGGKNYTQVAKVTFEIGVSIN
jgi:hypothetical protein